MIESVLSPRSGRRDVHDAEREALGLREVLPYFARAGTRCVGEAIVGCVAAPGEALPPDARVFYDAAALAASAAIVGYPRGS